MSPRDVLFNWRDQNKQCLALTDVHIETSGGIRVTVMPFYMGCRVRGRGRWVGSTHTKMVGNMACGVSDTACTDCWAVFLFVQEVQQAKVHWVSGKIRDSCVCAQAHTHTHTHTHTHAPSSCSGGTTFGWRTLQVTVSS